MIISRTPLRVSFLGGGSDFPDFYRQHGGAVISAAIDKFIYVIAKRRFDDKIVLHYTRTEIVDTVDEIQHELIREAMKLIGIDKGIEITTLADVPSEGTGLGSSSSMIVGLLNALYAYLGVNPGPAILADDACKIEIDILKKGIGKQDQYIAAFGGLRMIAFQKSGIDSYILHSRTRKDLNKYLMLYYTGSGRSASDVLHKSCECPDRDTILKKQAELCASGYRKLMDGGYEAFGKMITEGWELKKQLADCVTTEAINQMQQKALSAGAIGCKVCGAGGGGFMLVFCDNQAKVKEVMVEYRELPVKIYPEGSKIVYREKK